MPQLDEACVLIPSSTLEDFPTGASDADARSLLAAWTVLWHPALLAETEQLPTWYRADSPPETPGARLFTVPTLSLPKLPTGYEAKCGAAEGCRWVTGANRAEMLDRIGLSPSSDLDAEGRSLGPADFFAFGYANLQVQVMTRRLRYTSNLDELRVQERIVAAAKAFMAGDAEAAAEGLHDAFDLLAEERDHYFASDPSLIDLTLLSPSTLRRWAESLPQEGESLPQESESLPQEGESLPQESRDDRGDSGATGQGSRLRTPGNVLIDAETAAAVAGLPEPLAVRIREAIAAGEVGWAGGGPAASVCLDLSTLQAAERRLAEAWRETTESLGSAPTVYARFGGATPADVTAILLRLGCKGLIPIDFAGGTGFGDEAKVIRQAGHAEIEALTAKPIDAAGDAAFLTLAPRLGEAIDSGEIATALIAHWPGATCDSFGDLRRVASWSLTLGRFWKLDEYFTEGEHPYHHENVRGLSADAPNRLVERVAGGERDPIQTTARQFRREVCEEQQSLLLGMTDLVRGDVHASDAHASDAHASDAHASDARASDARASDARASDARASETGSTDVNARETRASDVQDPFDSTELATAFAAAVGYPVSQAAASGSDPPAAGPRARSGGESGEIPAAVLLVNAGSSGCRQTVRLLGPTPEPGGFIYGSDRRGGQSSVTADVPALGFSLVSAAGRAAKKRRFSLPWGGPDPIATGTSLQNEFMEVVIDPRSGGISAVHSGPVRGNRFSMRLVHAAGNVTVEPTSIMRANRCEIATTSLSCGTIEASGVLQGDAGAVLAEFELRYTLRRGSRLLEVSGQLRPVIELGSDPWSHFIAARVAVASEATSFRGLVRDKVHRSGGKRIVAPLGILIDEADRQTLVASAGIAYFRRAGERFVDTLLAVRGESDVCFSMAYGFDVRHPVAVARSWIASPSIIPVATASSVDAAAMSPRQGWMSPRQGSMSPRQGWIVYASPAGLLVSALEVCRRRDGKLAAVVRVIRTQNEGGKATLRFCRDVSDAMRYSGEPSAIDADSEEGGTRLDFSGDQVRFTLGGHGMLDILVVFTRD